MRLFRRPFVAIAIALCCAVPSARAADSPAAAPASKAAERLITAARDAVAKVQTTRYEHKTSIDEAAGQYICDCSGFVVYLIRKHLPEHFKHVPKDSDKPRAVAENFHALAENLAGPAQGGWKRVEKLADARPGDLIVWRHNDPKPGSTGHVMLIDSAAKPEGKQFRLTVIDSARSPHDRDTRSSGSGGVGRGDIFLTVDTAGRPEAWRWSKPDGKLNVESIRLLRPVDK